jgi:DNA-binding CsgD family transcriptional regulator
MMSPQGPRDPYALALHATRSGLWVFDIDADTIECDNTWYRILGLDRAKNPVRNVEEWRPYIHPEDVDRATAVDLDKVDEWIARDEIYHVDFRVVRPDATIVWVRSVACLVMDPTTAHRCAVGCITDITGSATRGSNDFRAREGTAAAEPDAARDGVLTVREVECLRWVSLGKTAEETGTILGISRRTVEFHLGNATQKLGAVNKIHATTLALARGLL